MNKRGGLWWELIELLIVLVLVAGTAMMLANYFGRGSGEERTTMVNFNSLVNSVNQLLNDGKEFSVKRHVPYFIGRDYFLVGYMVDRHPFGEARLPPACAKSCLCIYLDRAFLADKFEQALACQSIGAEHLFTLTATDAGPKDFFGTFKGSQYLWLHMMEYPVKDYGRYTNIIYRQEEAKPQSIYIEKIQKKGETYIFIAKESVQIQKRYNELFLKFATYEAAKEALLSGEYRSTILLANAVLKKQQTTKETLTKIYVLLGQAFDGILTRTDDEMLAELNYLNALREENKNYFSKELSEFDFKREEKPAEAVKKLALKSYEKAADIYEGKIDQSLHPKVYEIIVQRQEKAIQDYKQALEEHEQKEFKNVVEKILDIVPIRQAFYKKLFEKPQITPKLFEAYQEYFDSFVNHYAMVGVGREGMLPIEFRHYPGFDYINAIAGYKPLLSMFPERVQAITERISALCSRPSDEEHANDWDKQKETIEKLCKSKV